MAIFNEGLVRVAEQYLRKGSKVYLESQFQTHKWQDQSGNDRYSTEVVLQGCGSTLTMLDGGSGGGAPGGYDSGQSSPEPAAESSRMLSDKRAKASSFIRGQLLQVTKDRHSVRAALRLSLKVLRFESDLCELNRL